MDLRRHGEKGMGEQGGGAVGTKCPTKSIQK